MSLDGPTTTQMVHYECGVCDMQATCVATAASELAWLDHMDVHVVKDDFSAWTWTIQRLEF